MRLPFLQQPQAEPTNAVGTTPRGSGLQTTTAKASETLGGNSIVHVWNNASGQAQARNASALTTLKPARYYVKDPVQVGGVATLYQPGSIIPGFKLIPGADYFLSEIPGQITTTPPANAQYVGTATQDGTSLAFNPGSMQPASTPLAAGVDSFNGRTGNVELTADDIAATGWRPPGSTPSTPTSGVQQVTADGTWLATTPNPIVDDGEVLPTPQAIAALAMSNVCLYGGL